MQPFLRSISTQLLLRRLLIPHHPLHNDGRTHSGVAAVAPRSGLGFILKELLNVGVLKIRPLLLLETIPQLLLLVEEKITCSAIVCIVRSVSLLKIRIIVWFTCIVVGKVGIIVEWLNCRWTTIAITLEKGAYIQISTTTWGGRVTYRSELHLVRSCSWWVFIMNYYGSTYSMISSCLMKRAWIQSYHQLVIVQNILNRHFCFCLIDIRQFSSIRLFISGNLKEIAAFNRILVNFIVFIFFC